VIYAHLCRCLHFGAKRAESDYESPALTVELQAPKFEEAWLSHLLSGRKASHSAFLKCDTRRPPEHPNPLISADRFTRYCRQNLASALPEADPRPARPLAVSTQDDFITIVQERACLTRR
jgi:hypothetical protein